MAPTSRANFSVMSAGAPMAVPPWSRYLSPRSKTRILPSRVPIMARCGALRLSITAVGEVGRSTTLMTVGFWLGATSKV